MWMSWCNFSSTNWPGASELDRFSKLRLSSSDFGLSCSSKYFLGTQFPFVETEERPLPRRIQLNQLLWWKQFCKNALVSGKWRCIKLPGIQALHISTIMKLYPFTYFSLGGPQILVGLVTKDLGKMGWHLILLTGLYKGGPIDRTPVTGA